MTVRTSGYQGQAYPPSQEMSGKWWRMKLDMVLAPFMTALRSHAPVRASVVAVLLAILYVARATPTL
jgi:hypothetical protein